MSRDPFPAQRTLPQTWNQYPYALNNPSSRVDPGGLNPSLVHAGSIDERVLEEILFQECFKFTVLAVALAVLAIGT